MTVLIIIAAALFALALASSRKGAILWIVIPAIAFVFILFALRTERRNITLQRDAIRAEHELAAEEAALHARELHRRAAPAAPWPPAAPVAPGVVAGSAPEFWFSTEPPEPPLSPEAESTWSSVESLRPLEVTIQTKNRSFEIDGKAVLKGDQDGADTESFQRWARRQVHEKLATYFEQLAQDGTRLPDELAQVRSRLRELDPETRAAVARELAARLNVNPSVSPAPPDAPERDGRLLEFRTAVSPRSVRRMLDRQDDADVNPQSFLLTAGALVVAALVLKSATRRHGPASG